MSSIVVYSTRKTQKLDRTGALKGEPFRIFNIHSVVQNFKKLKGDPLKTLKIFEKSFTMPKKTERGIFQHPFCRKITKNWKGDPSVKNFFSKKSLTEPKIL